MLNVKEYNVKLINRNIMRNRMEGTQITKKIFNYINKMKNTIGWIEAVKKDAKKISVT